MSCGLATDGAGRGEDSYGLHFPFGPAGSLPPYPSPTETLSQAPRPSRTTEIKMTLSFGGFELLERQTSDKQKSIFYDHYSRYESR